MKKKENSIRKNKRFPARAYAIFAAAICLCMLFAACKDEPDTEVTPPDTREPTVTTPAGVNKPTLELANGETSVTLSVGATSADGSSATFDWSLKNGPKAVTFADKTANQTLVTGLDIAGTYVFVVEIKGSNGITKTQEVSVTVNADMRQPIISATGATPSSLTLPGTVTSVALNCTATSADDTAPKSVVWSVEEKPTKATPSISGNTASGLTVAGVYKFKVTVTGNNDVTKTGEVIVKANLDATVEFGPLAPSFATTTIDFSPSATLPAGVTYKLTDNKGHDWESGKDGFDGKVTASEYYTTGGSVTFTQTFYLHEVEITSTNSERTAVLTVTTLGGIRFGALTSDSGAVTLRYNP
jgi:hypothetical protein